MTRNYINFNKLGERADELNRSLIRMLSIGICDVFADDGSKEKVEAAIRAITNRCSKILVHANEKKREFDAEFIKRNLDVIIGDCREILSEDLNMELGRDSVVKDILGTIRALENFAEDSRDLIRTVIYSDRRELA